MFTWIPAYEQIAQRLLQYENRQNELIDLLEAIGIAGFNDKDAADSNIKLDEIDPLTFICYLNKYGDEKRLQFLRALCQTWNIAPLPTDVNGLPNVNAQKVWLFGYKKDRNANEVNRLWKFFKSLLNNTVNNAQFADVLTIFNVGKQKITEVMFMVNPSEHLCLNGIVKPYLQRLNLPTDFSNYDEYKIRVQNAKQQLQKSFPEISYEAWMQAREKPVVTPVQTVREDIPEYTAAEKSIPTSSHSLNTILYGPPGTGKTYHTILRAAEIVEGRSFESRYEDAKASFKKHIGEQAEFVTFHQNYSYEDFVAGLRPDVDAASIGLRFVEHKGIFYKICERARTNYKQHKSGQTYIEPSFEEVLEKFLEPLEIGDEIEVKTIARNINFHITANNGKNLSFRKQSGGTGHTLSLSTLKAIYEGRREYKMEGLGIYFRPVVERLKEIARGMRQETGRVPLKNYVLIIDEINRANISRVFGELITLIEPDKRLGAKHELMLTLPGLPEDEKFSVPSNVYIIGTMNTADKSIALVDIALRRRFVFEAMYPNPGLAEPPYSEFLKTLNESILEKKGADFMIGHSYLMPDEIEGMGFVNIMNQKIIPLLNEYFYNSRSITVYDLLKDIILKAGNYEVYVNPYKEVICRLKQ